ncbi:MAG: cytochrome c oxidase assembly protein [Alphaproteobacteria bacterium]
MSNRPTTTKNTRLGLILAGLALGMVGLAFASVPLYDLFCRVTGYGGTTQRASAAPDQTSSRVMAIRFNADVSPDLPWSFRPVINLTKVHLGEERLAFFQATNNSDEPIVGTAVFNVTPQKVGAYFNKVQCFCFEKQVLQPGETMDFPVSFFVDPDIETEKNLDDVKTITLSYTFFPSPDDAAKTAALRN